MVGNLCLPSVVPMNEAMRLQMKLDCHLHVGHVHCTDTAVLHHYAVVGDQQVRECEPQTQLSITNSSLTTYRKTYISYQTTMSTAKIKSANMLCPSIS